MTFRTRMSETWKNPLHAVWIILAIVELVVLFYCYHRFIIDSYFLPQWLSWARPHLPAVFQDNLQSTLLGPHIDAGAIRVAEGITAFTGKPLTGAWTVGETLVLVSMIFSCIAGPSLFLWGMKARRKWLLEKPERPRPFAILGAIAIGGYIVAYTLAIPIMTSVESWSVWQRMKSDSFMNGVRDGAVASVSELGFRAQLLRLMPEAKGGGPWAKGTGGITINDLEQALTPLERGLWSQGEKVPVKYFLEVNSLDSLTIWGVAHVDGLKSASAFTNKDGTRGNIQIRSGVTPVMVNSVMEN